MFGKHWKTATSRLLRTRSRLFDHGGAQGGESRCRKGGNGEEGLKGVQWVTNVQGTCRMAQLGTRVDGGDRERGVPRLGRGLCANGGDVGVGAVVTSGHVVWHGAAPLEVFGAALSGAVVRCFASVLAADELLRL